MKTAKDEVRDLLDTLPDEASLEEIQYHLYVRQKVLRGLAAARDGRTVSLDEAKARMSAWVEK